MFFPRFHCLRPELLEFNELFLFVQCYDLILSFVIVSLNIMSSSSAYLLHAGPRRLLYYNTMRLFSSEEVRNRFLLFESMG